MCEIKYNVFINLFLKTMEIKQIKEQLTIQKVLQHYNLEMDKNNLLKCCFHDDKTASLQIYTNTNTYHCFSCGKSGDTIQFIQDKEKITKHKAILKAKDLVMSYELLIMNDKEQKTNDLGLKTNYETLFNSFKTGILHSQKAQEYCKQRNLDIVKLGIGYNSGKDFKQLKNCIIFPLRNAKNEICETFKGKVQCLSERAYHKEQLMRERRARSYREALDDRVD